jgi:hypothetical protein
LFQFQRVDHLDKVDVVFDPPALPDLPADAPFTIENDASTMGIKAFFQSYFDTIITNAVSKWLNQNWKSSFHSMLDFRKPFQLQVVASYQKPGVVIWNSTAHRLVRAVFWVRSEFSVTERDVQHFVFNRMLVTTGTVEFDGLESILQVIQRPLPNLENSQTG